MQYVSTRGTAPQIGFCDVLLAGLARDGGLYVPQSWPKLEEFRSGDVATTYAKRAASIMAPLSAAKSTSKYLNVYVSRLIQLFEL